MLILLRESETCDLSIRSSLWEGEWKQCQGVRCVTITRSAEMVKVLIMLCCRLNHNAQKCHKRRCGEA